MSVLTRNIINTAKAYKPLSAYSQAIVWNRTAYISGVVGVDKDTMKVVDGGIEAETRQALKNLGQILEATDSSYENVIKTTILLRDMKDFATVNKVYVEFFKENYPARTVYQITTFPINALIEIEVIAGTGEVETILSTV